MDKLVYYTSILLDDMFERKGGTRGLVNAFFVNYVIMIIEAIFFLYDDGDRGWDEKRKKHNKLVFVVLVTIQWILVIGLRDNTVGSDTANYMHMFDETRIRSWTSILEEFSLFKTDFMAALTREIGFELFEKLVGSFTTDYVVYKFIVGCIIMIPFGVFIYRNSEDPFLSYSLFDAILYHLFAITGYRQTIAITISLIIGYEFIKKRNFRMFMLLIFFATFFHKSTLLIVPYYFLANKEITKTYRDLSIVIIILMIAFRKTIFPIAVRLLGYDEYGLYNGVTQKTFLLMYAILTALAIWRRDAVSEKYPESVRYYNALILSGFMLPFAMINPTALRMVYDYFLIVTLLIPQIMLSFDSKVDRMTAYALTTSIFFIYIFTKSPEYLFYWQ